MIDSFRGEYRFLSNFWPSPVKYDSIMFPTVEHAYVAAKVDGINIPYTEVQEMRFRISKMKTPGEVKRFGRTLKLNEYWDRPREHRLAYNNAVLEYIPDKFSVMRFLLEQKFRIPELKQLLLDTGDEELIEGNTWGDTYWGVCDGKGENNLGKLLMQIRFGHQQERDLLVDIEG